MVIIRDTAGMIKNSRIKRTITASIISPNFFGSVFVYLVYRLNSLIGEHKRGIFKLPPVFCIECKGNTKIIIVYLSMRYSSNLPDFVLESFFFESLPPWAEEEWKYYSFLTIGQQISG